MLLVIVGLCGLTIAQNGREAQDPGRRRPFIHLDHVPTVWANGSQPETLRDCRGCHQFGESSTRDPQAACADCHIQAHENGNQFQVVFKEGWETLDPLRTPNSMFQHYAHRELTCRECHQPESMIPSDPMPIRRGSQECIRCHGPASASMPLELDGLLGEPKVQIRAASGKMVDLLNNSPAMAAGTLGEFFHSEHLAGTSEAFSLAQLVAEAPMEGRCTSCHEPIVKAGLDGFQAKRFREDSCGQCHITESGPMSFGTSIETAESQTSGTFSHADHLGFDAGRHDARLSNEAGYKRIEESGCHACHEYDSEARSFLVKDAAGHSDCRSCHAADGWKVEQHGEWQAWGCMQCHSFAQSGALALDRPEAQVRRRTSTRFLVTSQVHPHIAGEQKTDVYKGNCVQCHRAPVKELPSRIGEREFNHASHLPENPSAEHCDRCHGARVQHAQSSVALAEQLSGASLLGPNSEQKQQLGLTFDLAACAECHLGGVLQPVQTEYSELATRSVPEFSHAAHIGKADEEGRRINCMSCHQSDGVSSGPVTTLPGAMNCTQCHNHNPGYSGDISGEATATELARCTNCHLTEIPAAGSTRMVERLRISEVVGGVAQFHPSDRECNDCHKSDWNRFGEPESIEGDHVFATLGRSLLPTGEILPHQHRGRNREGEVQNIYGVSDGFLRNRGGLACHWCHWTKGITAFDFESPNSRKLHGSKLKETDRKTGNEHVFPGGNYRALFANDRTPR